MTVIARLSTALVVLAAVLPYAAASTFQARTGGGHGGGGGYGGGDHGSPSHGGQGGGGSGGAGSCGQNQFWYGGKDCCLPSGGPSKPPSPPQGTKCPKNGYYWSGDKNCCLPSQPPKDDNPPPCDDDCSWDKGSHTCKPHGGKPPTPGKPPGQPPSNPGTPPSNPGKPPSGPGKPPGGTPPQGGDCENGHFWYPGKKCCLPHGGPPKPPQPPKGHQCPPNGWYWDNGKGCCLPNHPPPPSTPPQCPPDCSWNPGEHQCHPHTPPPVPSGHWGKPGHGKRSLKSRAASLCPTGLQACPITGLSSGEYECLDTKAELESCGGCTSIGQGQDCTKITGAWNVGCEKGSCAVYTCAAGFTRSLDGKSCIAI